MFLSVCGVGSHSANPQHSPSTKQYQEYDHKEQWIVALLVAW